MHEPIQPDNYLHTSPVKEQPSRCCIMYFLAVNVVECAEQSNVGWQSECSAFCPTVCTILEYVIINMLNLPPPVFELPIAL